MSTQGTSSSSSSSSTPTPQWKFDVFFNFRGVDTRKGFTDHLYATLQRKGIITFKDEEKLERGKTHFLRALESNRRIEICYCHFLKKLRIFNMVFG